LRDSDAGKNVAIPGAVDLIETITALLVPVHQTGSSTGKSAL
jgi:hypothetical protein